MNILNAIKEFLHFPQKRNGEEKVKEMIVFTRKFNR